MARGFSRIGTGIMAAVVLVAAALAAPAAAPAQDLELGAWTGRSVSSQVTTNFFLCAGSDCGEGVSQIGPERNAWTFGLNGRLHVVGPFSLRLGASLAFKGWGSDAGKRVDSRYLEFPVLVQVRLLRNGRASLHLAAGVAPSILIGCRYSSYPLRNGIREYESIPCNEPNWLGVPYGPAVKNDVGWVVAPAFRWQTDVGGLWIEPSYTHGRVNIRPDANGFTTNRYFALRVGLTRSVGRARRP